MDLFWFFPLLCLICMIGMLLMMFRSGGCMSMHRGRLNEPGDERSTPRPSVDRRVASGEIASERYGKLKRTWRTLGEMG